MLKIAIKEPVSNWTSISLYNNKILRSTDCMVWDKTKGHWRIKGSRVGGVQMYVNCLVRCLKNYVLTIILDKYHSIKNFV